MTSPNLKLSFLIEANLVWSNLIQSFLQLLTTWSSTTLSLPTVWTTRGLRTWSSGDFFFKLISSIPSPPLPPSPLFVPSLLSSSFFSSPLPSSPPPPVFYLLPAHSPPVSTSSRLSYRNGHSNFKSDYYPTLPATVSLFDMDKTEQGFLKPATAA